MSSYLYEEFFFNSVFFLVFFDCKSQLSGVYNIPSTYTSIASVVNDLNLLGISGNVTLNIASGYTETVPFGGLELTATGTSINSITFQNGGVGPNPILYAYSGGIRTSSMAIQDGIFRLIGSDFVTIDGIDLRDLNTTTLTTMEYGYALYKTNATDGCQNVTIKNCSISLSRDNNGNGAKPAIAGSRAIDVVNSTATTATTALVVTSPLGSHSNNKFYKNTIQNCNVAISLIGFKDSSPYSNADQNNDVGGSSAATGNSILGFGGSYPSNNAAYGVYAENQYGFSISNNYINNYNGLGKKHTNTVKAVLTNSISGSTLSITNNTITLITDTAVFIRGIENTGSSTTNTVNISGNSIINCDHSSTINHDFRGILNDAISDELNIINNLFQNNKTKANAGTYTMIHNNKEVNNTINITANSILSSTLTFGGIGYSLGYLAILTSTAGNSAQTTINSNTITGMVFNGGYTTGGISFIVNDATSLSGSSIITNNVIGPTTIPCTNLSYLINNNNSSKNILINNNYNSGPIVYNYSGISSTFSGIHSQNSVGSGTIIVSSNLLSNITVSGTTPFEGIGISNNNHVQIVTSNTVIGTKAGTGSITGIANSPSMPGSDTRNNYISNFNGAGPVYGMWQYSGPGYVRTATSNTIHALQSVANTTVCGIIISGGDIRILKNKIYNIESIGTSSCVVSGILLFGVGSSPTITIANNMIGDLRAPFANSNTFAHSIIGICLGQVNAGGSYNVLCNSVFLNTTSSGINFSSTCLVHSPNPNSTWVPLFLNNNIFINKSIPKGSGCTSAFSRASNSLANFNIASDRNIFYAGTPGPNNLIYNDYGGNYQTLTSYQIGVAPRDANSITEDTPFLGTIGSFTNFLHIDPSSLSLSESNAANLLGITDDYDTDIRQGNPGYAGTGTAPDIGADEYEKYLTPCTSVNAATIIPSSNKACTNLSAAFNSISTATTSGLQLQWQISTTPGGPYTNLTTGYGYNSAAYLTPTLSPGTYYLVLNTTCPASSLSAISNEATLTINPLPVITATASSIGVCAGGTVILNGQGGTSYAWSDGIIDGIPYVLPPVTKTYSVTGTDINGCTNSNTITITILTNPAILLSVNPGTLICAGNSVIINASSSTTPAVSYTWSTGATTASITTTPTVLTTYSVVGTNSLGCSHTRTINIGVTSPPTLTTTSSSSVICPGKTCTLIASGASTYTWNPGPISATCVTSPTTTTTYTVIGSNAPLCTSTNTIVINVSPSATVTTSASSSLICTGQTSTLVASGANTYTWNTGPTSPTLVVTPTTTTTYSVTGTNTFGCSQTKTVSVTVSAYPTLTATCNTGLICPGINYTLTASGASTYTWTSGPISPTFVVSPTVTTTYSVAGTNTAGCTSTQTVTLNYYTPPTIVTTTSNSLICIGQTATIVATNTSVPTTYTWNTGVISPTLIVTPTVTTTYSVSSNIPGGCTVSTTLSIIVSPCTSVENYSTINYVEIYPNPTNELLNINSTETYSLILFDITGEIIYESKEKIGRTILNVSEYNPGLYLLKISIRDVVLNRKIIVER